MQLMTRFAAAGLPEVTGLRDGDVLAVRVVPLRCVRQGVLVEYDLAGRFGDWTGMGAFIWLPNRFVSIDGSSLLFHQLREEGRLALDTAELALEFASLFAASVNGDDGSFNQFRRGWPLELNPDHPSLPESLRTLAAGPDIDRDDNDWKIVMTIAYGAGFFRSTLRVGPRELIAMDSDEHLEGAGSPVALRWIDGVRRVIPVDADRLKDAISEKDKDEVS